MKKNHRINSVKSKVDIPGELLENYVNNRYLTISRPEMDSRSFFSEDFKKIYWCAALTMVNGSVEINFIDKDNKAISTDMPVRAGFLLICTKQKPGDYKLTFGISLS